jgi:hypothetical protein
MEHNVNCQSPCCERSKSVDFSKSDEKEENEGWARDPPTLKTLTAFTLDLPLTVDPHKYVIFKLLTSSI